MAADVIAVRDTKAAKMLDLSAAEFRRLVACGALPPPKLIEEYERWYVKDIEGIMHGRTGWPDDEDIEA